jgi:hypothetical protein
MSVQNKRSPLHFAAALQDSGVMYRQLRRSGADPDIIDCVCDACACAGIQVQYGHAPKYYLNHPGELDLANLRLDTRAALKHVLRNRIAPSYLQSSIGQWLREVCATPAIRVMCAQGSVGKLEQLVLSGCGDMLLGKTSTNVDCNEFLAKLPDYLVGGLGVCAHACAGAHQFRASVCT